jgi:hypothetical protein
MKRCPNCQRTYPDDAPGFCVNDGTQLVTEEPPAYDPQKTILASPPPAPPPTPQYNPAPPQAPPQQYQSPNDPAGIKPPTGWQPQPPQAQPPAAAPWPPPPPQQQGQWGGGGYYPQAGQQQQPQPYGAPYPAAVAQSKGLSMSSFITGIVSFLGFMLLILMINQVIDFDKDVAGISGWGSALLGVVAIVLGLLALISKKQRNKWMAIAGIVLGIPAIVLLIYLLTL